jgi:hypothetical protein
MNNKFLTKVIAVIITIILLALLFTQINLGDVILTIKGLNPIYLIAGFILYTCSYFFRAWRFHILLNKEVSIKDLFNIGCVHNLMNNLLPARTGELSYIYLLKKHHKRTIGEGIATLVVARIFDFIALGILFFGALFTVNDVPPIIMDALWIIALIVITLFFLLGMILYRGRSFINLIDTATKLIHLENNKIAIYCLQKGFETADSLEKINVKKIFVPMVAFSILIWVFNYAMGYLVLVAMRVILPIQVIVLGMTFTLLSTTLPIYGILGFGTNEGFWTLVFVPLGMTVQMAILSGFTYHIILIIDYLILGCIGYFSLKH